MNLQWDLTSVENSDALCWDARPDGKYELTNLTESIINLTAVVGINKLTGRTAKEFGRRASILKVMGVPILKELNQDIIDSHVGLETSAIKLDYRGFKNQVFESLEQASKGVLDYNGEEEKDDSTSA
jgi:hypothetical protein